MTDENYLKKQTSLIFRVAGIIFFVLTMVSVVELFQVNLTSYMYLINGESRGWAVFFIVSAVIFTTFFLFSLFASGTAAIYGGKGGFTQSVWNCSVYALVSLALYTSLELVTGLDSEMQFYLIQSIVMQIIFCIVIFTCLKENETFSWKNIIPSDPNSKLCLKVYLIMLVLIQTGCFIYAHRFVES